MIRYLFTRKPAIAVALLTVIALLCFDTHAYAVSTTDVVEAFKYTYGASKLAYLAATEIVAWNILSRKKDPMGGRGQYIIPIQKRNAGVFVGHAEGGAKTTRRAQPTTTEATFALQEFHGIFDLSWKMLQDARNSEYAFQKALDFMDSSFRRRVFRLLNAEILGYGRGELGILPAADDATQITVRALPMVDEGMIVDLMDASDDDAKVGPTAATVTAIDVRNRAITTGTAGSGTAAGDYFTVADSVSSSGGSLHLAGLGAWISASNPATVVGNLGGINRSTAGNEFWQATVLGNSGTNRPLTEDLMLEGMDTQRERGGSRITDLMSNLKIIRRYHEMLREDVFYSMGKVSPLASGSGLGRDEDTMRGGGEDGGQGETPYMFSGIPWRAEMFMDANRIWGFDRDALTLVHGENDMPAPLSEIFDDMVSYFTPTANTTFEVVSYWQAELVSDRPTALVGWEDIAES